MQRKSRVSGPDSSSACAWFVYSIEAKTVIAS